MPGAVSNRYAQALADAVLSPSSPVEGPQAAAELRDFRAMMKQSADLRNVLLSPAVSLNRKRAVVARIASLMPLSTLVRNFLFVLIDRRRTDLIDEILVAFESALDERLGFVRVEVSSARPLSEARKRDLEAALSKVAGRAVRCQFKADPTLLGGVVARIGSTVYDGSVRTQLERLRQRLVS